MTLSHTGNGSTPAANPLKSAACSTNGQYVAGQSITLSGAAPDTGWHIAGWTGTSNNTSTADTNSLTMPASAHAASVTYTQDEYTLTVVSAHGTVSKTPDQSTYHYGDVVTLSATAEAGWTFTGWTPALTDDKVTITGDSSVTANYTRIRHTLTVSKTGNGVGMVRSTPAGIDCGVACAADYDQGTSVTLDAIPNIFSAFAGWSGACTGTGACVVTMDTAQSVTAEFSEVCYSLTTAASPAAGGDVDVQTLSNCVSSAGKYRQGTVVSLQAAANAGYTFASWSGGASGTTNPTTVTMTEDKSVTAHFVDTMPPTLDITGATADGSDMGGDLASGYILNTSNVPTVDHLIQFKSTTTASEPLAAAYFGLKLINSTVSATDLKAYYAARGVPEPFLSYLQGAADGIQPFVYIKGTTVTLVDAAKHDLVPTDVDMTVPDNFPLGTYTVAGEIRDVAGNESTVTLILKVTGDRVAPTLDITGATADGSDMGGDLASGYILNTSNVPTVDHLIQFKSTTTASEPLAAAYFGLKLINSTVSATELKAYYAARGVPEPYLSYLQDAADGTQPFVYIKGTTVTLVDAAKHDLVPTDVAMTVPDDFPLGTYTVAGKIRDVAGNETP